MHWRDALARSMKKDMLWMDIAISECEMRHPPFPLKPCDECRKATRVYMQSPIKALVAEWVENGELNPMRDSGYADDPVRYARHVSRGHLQRFACWLDGQINGGGNG